MPSWVRIEKIICDNYYVKGIGLALACPDITKRYNAYKSL
jgi:hypothetical protein